MMGLSSGFWEVLRGALMGIVVLLAFYTARHVMFSLQRLFGRQRGLYAPVALGPWPRVTVFIAAHNEEEVIADCLESLLAVDYPHELLTLMPVNDRSSDGTYDIIESYVRRYPGRIRPFHRKDGKPGKAAALKDATQIVRDHGLGDIIVVFDADYTPSRSLLKQILAPFFDPEVGCVMGRVVPQNAGVNLLTRILDLERSGGYQVDQQARENIVGVPQYGGTVGGIRLRALADAGGWHDDVLAEDTDLTFRLLRTGWRTVYINHAECYEEVPQSWAVRARQIGRWAKGHNQALARHGWRVLHQRTMPFVTRIDATALLGVYIMAPIQMLGWMLALLMFYGEQGANVLAYLSLATVMVFSCFGNFAAFFEVAAAVHLDGHRGRLRLLPLLGEGFLVSVVSITKATLDLMVLDRLLNRQFQWDKTARYRRSQGAPALPGSVPASGGALSPALPAPGGLPAGHAAAPGPAAVPATEGRAA
ncbi:glycosyltransferase [Brachymonas sp. M4Q-1]|uniref:glycosyltransferase n=1 Tax=Brachymonas sp. M4Q-1 TaxID=3416906 RepID=UPI003CF43284